MDIVQLSIRGVPSEVADSYKRWAADEGKSLNAYILHLLNETAARRLSQENLLARFAGREFSDEDIAAHEALIESLRNEWVE